MEGAKNILAQRRSFVSDCCPCQEGISLTPILLGNRNIFLSDGPGWGGGGERKRVLVWRSPGFGWWSRERAVRLKRHRILTNDTTILEVA